MLLYNRKGYATELDIPVIDYGIDYYNNYKKLEGTGIDFKIQKCRKYIVQGYCQYEDPILDFGCGTGQFLKHIESKYKQVYGFDIMVPTQQWLQATGIFLNPYTTDISKIKGVCFWDSLEHLTCPHILLKIIPIKCYVFISIPIFDSLDDITTSKHYKPGEHFYYFTDKGLKSYMEERNFRHIKTLFCETEAGRENIVSYIFQRESKRFLKHIKNL